MLKINPNPTFKALVSIPQPGAKPANVEFEFKHMSKDAAKDYFDPEKNKDADGKERAEIDTVMGIVAGWTRAHVDAEFSKDNMELLLQQYAAAARVIGETYLNQLYGLKSGN